MKLKLKGKFNIEEQFLPTDYDELRIEERDAKIRRIEQYKKLKALGKV
jgi:hypothetical protein